jgi:ribosomal protein S18 acetylase RimI-like enzyme
MERPHLHGIKKPGSPEIEEATPSDVDQVYAVLCEAFKKNPDTSIPERESWGANFLRNPKSRYFVWRENGAILGFSNLIPKDENTAEINTIGVLWESRGRGLGRQLLDRALVAAFELGFKKCHLVVATANKNALGLYQRAGFEILSQQSSYRWSKEQ